MTKVAICIPVYNEEKNISSVIQNILSQRNEKIELEILIVSSNSIDKTNEIIREYIKSGFPVNLIIEPERTGKANAINNLLPILENLKPDICVFTDGDVYIGQNSIEYIVENFVTQSDLSGVVGHPVPVVETNNLWDKIAIENCAIWNEVRLKQNESLGTWTFSGYLFAVTISALPQKIEARTIAEDAFWGLSLLLAKKKLAYEYRSLVYVRFPSNIKDYYIQKSRTRSGWAQLAQISPQHFRELQKTQRNIVISRIRRGYIISFLCYVIDKSIWFLDWLFTRRERNRHIWQVPKSTK